MSFLDNVIGYFSPRTALERARMRMAWNEMRKYEGAASGRRTSGWHSSSTSANQETYSALTTLRNRARDLVRNNPYAKNAIDVITTNTIGTGILPRPKVEGAQGEKIIAEWNKWAGTKACDFDKQHTFYGIQALAMKTIAQSGEVLIRKRMVNDKKNPLRLQVLEPDFLDTSKHLDALESGGYVIQGVEFDKDGNRIGYWLFDTHPGEDRMGSLKSKMVPADEVLHVYSVERPGQVRGVPFGASAMMRLRDFDDYEDAQLMRQKIAACFAVFVQDASADAIGGSTANDELPERVEPGIIEKLPAGKTVTFATPPGAEGYGEYTRKVLQAIAIGYGITYEALTSDLSNVNFSSGRMGWLEFSRRISHWQQNIFIPMLCEDVWNWWVKSKNITGDIKGEVDVEWTTPRREMIDPVKETEAMALAIRNGLTSWQEAVRELGYDPNTLIAQIVEDNKKFDENKIVLESDPRVKAAAKAPSRDESSQNNTQE